VTAVDELLGGETGRYRIQTRDSHYVVDLGEGTVQRFPGPISNPSPNDALRRIRDIRTCKVGEHGYWTMHPADGDPTVDYLWQYTSEIKSIDKEDPDDANR
jgi:hypothetical protein